MKPSLAFALIAALLFAAPGGTFPDEGPVFVVHTAAGDNLIGPLAKLAQDWTVRLTGDRPALVEGKEVVTIRRQNLALPDFPKKNAVILTHGDRIPIDLETFPRLEEGRLVFSLPAPLQSKQGQTLSVPRAFVAVLWLAAPEGSPDPDLMIRRLLTGKRQRDVLFLKNGDQVEGAVTALDGKKGCRMEAGKRVVEVDSAQVAAIAFNTELQARVRPPKNHAHLVLTGGGRVSFHSVQLESGSNRLKGKSLVGAWLDIPLHQVAALEPRLGQTVFLSDLKPRDYQHTSFLNVAWPLVSDASVVGRPLRLGGSTFDKGLGMHSESRVTYELNGSYRWFEATVGLDERSGRRGRVRLQVLVDGKEQNLGWDKELTGKDAPLAVRIDVSKARALTLSVRFGSFGDVEAHVNWAHAVLIK